MLAEIIGCLACPVCQGQLTETTGALRCARGHSYDIARQGYVNLLVGPAPAGAETTDMVTARAELLGAGHYAPVAAALAETAAALAPSWPNATDRVAGLSGTRPIGREDPRFAGLVVDAGAGTGYYLGAVLDALHDRHGLALDVAKAAVRRAARAHSRAAAAVCDVWRGLPLMDGCADLILNVFAPRNATEFRRVLRPTGALIVVTPRADHLTELVAALDLVRVDPAKQDRLVVALGDDFDLDSRRPLTFSLRPDRADAARLVAMGPSAWHTDPTTIRVRLEAIPEPLAVTVDVDVSLYRPTARRS
jgi:23S rRNA (guanine745-N1)-methyltransferase